MSPIFKKKDKTFVENYRPVSVLPTVSKIFERIMQKQISDYIGKLLSPFLCGYRKGFSTRYALLKELQNCILCVVGLWSLFCSVRVSIILHFLPILLVKLSFRLSMFWLFIFLFLWFLDFSFSVLCFEFNVISKVLKTLLNFVLNLFKRSVKI